MIQKKRKKISSIGKSTAVVLPKAWGFVYGEPIQLIKKGDAILIERMRRKFNV